MRTSSLCSVVVCTLGTALVLSSCSKAPGTGSSVSSVTSSGTTSVSLFSSSSSSSVSPLSMTADVTRALAGQMVTYTVAVGNTTQTAFSEATVDVTFPSAKLSLVDAGGGTVTDDRLEWEIKDLQPGRIILYTFRGVLSPTLQTDDLVRVVVSLRSKDLPTPAISSAEITIGTQTAAQGSTSSVASSGVSTSSSSSATLGATSSLQTASGYDFFVGAGVGSSATSSSSVSQSAAAGQSLSVAQTADQTERQAGESVRYTVTVRNVSRATVENISIQALFPKVARVQETGGGAVRAQAITWTVSSLASGETKMVSYVLSMSAKLRQGDVVTTVSQVQVAGAVPQVATTDVHILKHLPQTGAEDKFFAPLENTSKYLRKM